MPLVHDYNCVDCNEFTDCYMAYDDVWTLVAKRTECLCLACFEKRLGRDLVLSDFSKVKINRPIFLGAVMARKDEADKRAKAVKEETW